MKFYQIVLIENGERKPLLDMFDLPSDAEMYVKDKKRAHPEREYEVEEIEM